MGTKRRNSHPSSRVALEWKGIEATEKLASSSYANVVIVGNTKNGLPLVLEPK